MLKSQTQSRASQSTSKTHSKLSKRARPRVKPQILHRNKLRSPHRRIFTQVAHSFRHTLANIGDQPFHEFLASRRLINGVQERAVGLSLTRGLQKFVDMTRPHTPTMHYLQVSYRKAPDSTYAQAYKEIWCQEIEAEYRANLKTALTTYADHIDSSTYPTTSPAQLDSVNALKHHKEVPENAEINYGSPISLLPPLEYDFSKHPGGIVYEIDDHSEGMTIYGPSVNWHPNAIYTYADLIYNPQLIRQKNLPLSDIRANDLMWNPAPTGEEIPQNANVVMYIHGGSHVIGSPRWVPYQLLSHNWSSLLNKASDLTHDEAEKFSQSPEKKWYVISINYHLSPENAQPQSLLDCLSAYQTILETYNPRNIVLSGDSAGGQLASALALALQHLGNRYGTDKFVPIAQRVATDYVASTSEKVVAAVIGDTYPFPLSNFEKAYASSNNRKAVESKYLPRPTFDPRTRYGAGIRQPDSLVLFSPVCNVSPRSDAVSTLGMVADIDAVLPARSFASAMQALFGLCKSVPVKPGSMYDPNQSITSSLSVSSDLYATYGRDIKGLGFAGLRQVRSSLLLLSTFAKGLLGMTDQSKESQQHVASPVESDDHQCSHPATASQSEPNQTSKLEQFYRPFGIPTVLPLPRHITTDESTSASSPHTSNNSNNSNNTQSQPKWYGKPLTHNPNNYPAVQHTVQSLALLDTMVNHYSASPNRAKKNANKNPNKNPHTPTLDALPPTFIVVGRNEMLLGDTIELLSGLSNAQPPPDTLSPPQTRPPATSPSSEQPTPSPYHIDTFSGFYTNESGSFLLPKTKPTANQPLSPLSQHRTITPLFLPSSTITSLITRSPELFSTYTAQWKAYCPTRPHLTLPESISTSSNTETNFFYHPALHKASQYNVLDDTQISRSYINGLLHKYVIYDENAGKPSPSAATQDDLSKHWDSTHYAKFHSFLDHCEVNVSPFTTISQEETTHSLKMITMMKQAVSNWHRHAPTASLTPALNAIKLVEELTHNTLHPDQKDPPIVISTEAHRANSQQDETPPTIANRHKLLILPNMFHVFVLLPMLPHSKQSLNMATSFILDNSKM